jgi:hypothetical protein
VGNQVQTIPQQDSSYSIIYGQKSDVKDLTKILEDEKPKKKEISFANFTYCKFLVDSKKTDFINDLIIHLKSSDCELIFNKEKFSFEISSTDPKKIDEAF